ncbi:DNA/RNA nuclease SfsA [Aliivibrio fischeri]|uniref:Sugar fermentation stimulation protein homolog n=1 Tax=Aliivibrio fischeri (strain MJ11) TaxID=388396 RepID=SFSA_ALIFM|nr:DNA/RNA nuclease SfsA [Aliivibrio fischeri]B5FAP6.1 RecName: Full=Sugar fermentation stimulation protein homolog [Aliivibrio fischeri MJ11]ACH65247.1 sugar fermentation stimulation protein [Aliivibrio fischeri MJ11]MCE4936078.1 DNA/RNA nuclease SfsA [Aliivibrio fischeri]MUH98267.1 DNA/RNA nuclease SfsA [Aliivibrio fischeri]MUI64386.1 DNA/RNA nuclease SfsA [Aliivibrio fischeri]OCH31350.1 sugar fermentation stimulation protein SfsA [Aliivibrio fischeri]
MKFEPELESGKLIKRYKRFLADIKLEDNSERTIHCANTGAMTGCAEPDSTVFFSTSSNLKRKYPNSWELSVTENNHTICVNTLRANQLVVEAIQEQNIKELTEYDELKTEVKYGSENSRIDILLTGKSLPDCYIEVKSVTLLSESGQGFFPDAVTTRGQKHLRELSEMAQLGHKAVLFFAVLHSGIEKVSIAHHIDQQYHSLLIDAIENGVNILCYQAEMSSKEMKIVRKLPFSI